MDYERRIEKLELKLAPKRRFVTVFLLDEGQDVTEAKRATGNDPDDPTVDWFFIHLHRLPDKNPTPVKDEVLADEIKARAEMSRLEELRRYGLAE